MDVNELPAALASVAPLSTSQRPAAYADILARLLNQPASKLPPDAFQRALDVYLDTAAFSDLNSSGGGLVVGRQVLAHFNDALLVRPSQPPPPPTTTTPSHHTQPPPSRQDEVMTDGGQDADLPAIADAELRISVLQSALEKVQPRVLSFEEQASAIRLHLADLLEADEEWSEAARVLQGISLESGHRAVSALYKLRIYVRIVRLLLEADDAVSADVFLKRASLVVHDVPGATTSVGAPGGAGAAAAETQQEGEAGQVGKEDRAAALQEGKVLGLQYKLCQARINDVQRRFHEAAVRFHELSYVPEIDEGERTQMLSAAVTASILSPAGPQRSRLLAALMRDERTASLPQHTILSKVFLDHIVRPDEVASFGRLLAPHQKAALPPSANESAMRAVAVAAEAEARQRRGAIEPSSSSSTGAAMEEDRVEDDGDRGGGVAGAEDAADTAAAASRRAGPTTVLERAMMEHNLLSASRCYSNITFAGLGALLDLSAGGAESMARRMVAQGRLRAELDQVEGLLVFREPHHVRQEAGMAGVAANKAAAAAAAAAGGGDGAGGAGASSSADAAASRGAVQGTSNAKTTTTTAATMPADGVAGLPLDDPQAAWTGKWDAQIARTAAALEEVCARLRARNLLPPNDEVAAAKRTNALAPPTQ